MAVLFPGENTWELWRGSASLDTVTPLDLGYQFESESEPEFSQNDRGQNVVALPVRSVMALPMWVRAPGEREMHQAAKLQLERAGLRARNEPQGIDFSLVEKSSDGTNSLILAQSLTDRTPQLATSSAPPTDHLAAPFLLPLPPDHLTIWRELGRLVAAVTRNGKVVHFDALTSSGLDESAIQEVHRMAAQLSLLDMLDNVQGIVLWTTEGDAQQIADATGLPVDRALRPAPILPQSLRSRLEPRSAKLARELAQRRARKQKIFRNVALVVGAIALLAGGVLGWFSWQRSSLRAEVSDLRPQAAKVEAMRERWSAAAPAVDKDKFVLETLLAVQSIPAAQSVSLERFELTLKRISIEGSAAGATQALRFLDALSGSQQFADYEWTFPQPKIDGATAHFEIQGENLSTEEDNQP
jgi:hypothetical protein